MINFISKIISYIIYFFFLFIISGIFYFYSSDLHNRISIDLKKSNIYIKELKILNYLYIKKLNIENISFFHNTIKFDNLDLNGLKISYDTNHNNNLKTSTDTNNSINNDLFTIIHSIFKYIDIKNIKSIQANNIFINNKQYFTSFIKKKDKIELNINNIVLKFQIIDKYKIKYIINDNLNVFIDIKDNFLSCIAYFDKIFLLSGDLTIQDNIILTNVKQNKKYFQSVDIFNNIKLKINSNMINNNYFSFNLNTKLGNLNIPWLKYNEYNLFNIKSNFNINKNIINIGIEEIRNDDISYKDIHIQFNYETLEIKLFIKNKNILNGKFFISDKNDIYIHINDLNYMNINITDEDIYILKEGISTSFFTIYSINNSYKIVFNKKFDDFFKKNFSKINSYLQDFLKFNSFTDIDLVIQNNPHFDFKIKYLNDVVFGSFENNIVFLNFDINKIFINDNLSINKILLNGFYNIENNSIEFNYFKSNILYKNISFPLFAESIRYNLITGNLYIPSLNDNFNIIYQDEKIQVLSNNNYIIKNNKIGKITFSKIDILYSNNSLNGEIILGNSDIKINKKILDFLTTDNIKKYKSDIDKNKLKLDSSLKYNIHLLSKKNSIQHMTYNEKKLDVNINNIDMLFKNNFLGGQITLRDGNLDFLSKKYKILASNISILDNKVILSLNSSYEDDNVKVNIGIFGNADDNNLFLSLNSEPTYSEGVLIKYLFFDGDLEDDGNTLSGDLINIGIDKFKNFFNIPIDSIKILEKEDGESKYQINKKLNKNISVQYTKDTDDNNFEIIYKINRQFNVNSYTNGKSSGVKLVWEFDY
jgi:hypothetical protein